MFVEYKQILESMINGGRLLLSQHPDIDCYCRITKQKGGVYIVRHVTTETTLTYDSEGAPLDEEKLVYQKKQFEDIEELIRFIEYNHYLKLEEFY